MMERRWRHYIKRNLEKRKRKCCCCICGTKKSLTLHHKIPLEVGGLDDLDNIIYLCKKHHKELHEPADKHHKINPNARWYLKRIGILRKKYMKQTNKNKTFIN